MLIYDATHLKGEFKGVFRFQNSLKVSKQLLLFSTFYHNFSILELIPKVIL